MDPAAVRGGWFLLRAALPGISVLEIPDMLRRQTRQ
jgi:hypothetical protein